MNLFDDFTHWGITEFYPLATGDAEEDEPESCVNLIFINDSNNPQLRDDCIIEFNFGDTSNGLTYDTSGQGNIGIHIGDFEVTKTNKKTPVRRDSSLNVPETSDIERAI